MLCFCLINTRHCDKCGSEGQYTLTYERHIKYIFNGPFTPPIGYENHGSQLIIKCDVCKWFIDPTDEDIDRFYGGSQLDSIVFFEHTYY